MKDIVKALKELVLMPLASSLSDKGAIEVCGLGQWPVPNKGLKFGLRPTIG